MAAKSHIQLLDAGLTFIDDPKGQPWFVDTKHTFWDSDIHSTMLKLARSVALEDHLPDIQIWRRRKDTTKCGDMMFHHIKEFHLRKSDKYPSGPNKGKLKPPRFDPMLVIEKNNVKNTTSQSYRDQNTKVFRYYMMGSPDSPVFCPMENILIDGQSIWGEWINNCWQQHHFVFVESKSLQKDGPDPGKNNSTTDMTNPSRKSRLVLEDTMRTIFLSATAHDKIHKAFDDGDITFYANHQLPWALRNEMNWTEFTSWLQSLGHEPFPTYSEWYESLKIENNLHFLTEDQRYDLQLRVKSRYK